MLKLEETRADNLTAAAKLAASRVIVQKLRRTVHALQDDVSSTHRLADLNRTRAVKEGSHLRRRHQAELREAAAALQKERRATVATAALERRVVRMREQHADLMRARLQRIRQRASALLAATDGPPPSPPPDHPSSLLLPYIYIYISPSPSLSLSLSVSLTLSLSL